MSADGQRVVVREERGWSVHFSRSGIGFRRFSQRYEDVVAGGPPRRHAPEASWRRWVAPLLLACGSLTAGVLAAPMRTATGYSLVMPVPDAPPRPALATPKPKPAVGLAAHAPRRTAPAVAAAPSAEARFTDIAMRTGAMQEWDADGVRHFLVAGDLDAKACRQFSLLSRPDGGVDSVRQFERCRGE